MNLLELVVEEQVRLGELEVSQIQLRDDAISQTIGYRNDGSARPGLLLVKSLLVAKSQHLPDDFWLVTGPGYTPLDPSLGLIPLSSRLKICWSAIKVDLPTKPWVG